MITSLVEYTGRLVCCLGLLLLCATTVHAQVRNSSFEQGGNYTTADWRFTDASCQQAFNEVPPDGGLWSLRLDRINLQGGCFGVAYQVIPEVKNGEVWSLTAWARTAGDAEAEARIYWTKFAPMDSTGRSPFLPEPNTIDVSTSSDQWTLLAIVDTLFVADGDSIGIVLSAGVTSGPTDEDDFVYFDLISAEKVGQLSIQSDVEEQPETPVFTLTSNFPNPFTASTSVSFTLHKSAFVVLDIFDLLGRKVHSLVNMSLSSGIHTASWEAGDLPDGIYVGRLQAGDQVQTMKLVRLR